MQPLKAKMAKGPAPQCWNKIQVSFHLSSQFSPNYIPYIIFIITNFLKKINVANTMGGGGRYLLIFLYLEYHENTNFTHHPFAGCE